jgi:2,5-dioxopentanoate dehydrogenase
MITGDILIGTQSIAGQNRSFWAINPRTGAALEPAFAFAGREEVARACKLAWTAFHTYRETRLEERARFLETIAANVMEIGDTLVDRATVETGLSRGRIEGERARTVGQLRLFAEVVRQGEWLDARIDPAMPDRKPVPRPDLRLRNIALGPVAVFGASNFPLAFSVAGGDTASAFAAGCPVVVKGHPAHPGTSELVGRAIQKAVASSGMPEGVFSLLLGEIETGSLLVEDTHIKAVGFTGSRRGGLALMKIAAARPEPIPVYAEMSSINPVFIMPGALGSRPEEIARAYVASLTMGAGQFCTNPGLVFVEANGRGLDTFLAAARRALAASQPEPMLTPGIHAAYVERVSRLSTSSCVTEIGHGAAARTGSFEGQAVLFETDADGFRADKHVQEEVFGAASVVVRCRDLNTMRELMEEMEGQLTATVQLDVPADLEHARKLLPTLERKVGRILANGWPTGVEVGYAMVHGGPYPSTSDGRSTSVGTLAIRRFLRPVCYQDMPAGLLPQSLQDMNSLGLWRRVDGRLTQP